MYVTQKGGVFYAVVYLGHKDGGGENRPWLPLESTTADDATIEARLRYGPNALSGLATSERPAKVPLTVWVKRWLPVKYLKLRFSTWKSYDSYARCWILPALGNIFLEDITTWKVMEFQGLLASKPGRRGPLSEKTQLEITLALKLILKDAVKAGLITTEVMSDIELSGGSPPKVVPLSDDQARCLLRATRVSWLYPGILLGLLAGLRLGEVRGLLWSDLDFERATVSVTKAMVRRVGGQEFGPPKTLGSVRVLDLNPWVVDELRSIRELRASTGQGLDSEHVLISPWTGRAVTQSQFSKQYRPLALRLGISTRFHDLRHTHASQLLRLGVSIKVISARLGHTDDAFTLRTYIHLLPGEARMAISSLEDVYLQAPDAAA